MRSLMGFCCPVVVLLFMAGTGEAATIWTGPSTVFTKPAFADWTQPENQDRLTDNVWITRQDSMGIYNIKQETFYTHNDSPADTEWAYGSAANWPSLTFTNWEAWASNFPPGTVGQAAVLHL
ncbi:MAG: glucose dehydrogenase, partial [Planctomycetes bacterium]|nr:glucose dehydrogenase [Planctomycetota bacterium]